MKTVPQCKLRHLLNVDHVKENDNVSKASALLSTMSFQLLKA